MASGQSAVLGPNGGELVLDPGSPRVYRTLRALLGLIFAPLFRLKVTGRENVPITGGFILAPGAHRSILDTPLVSQVSPRILRYMGAEKYFQIPVLGSFLSAVGGFPVERELADRHALRIAEAILADGQPLVVFPESTRHSGPIVAPIKEGAAFLACRAGVPIIPVGIGGAERAMPINAKWIRPSRCRLIIGEPIYPPVREDGSRPKRSDVRALSAQLQDRLQELFDAAQIEIGA